jgi:hypothetical protein
MHYAHVQRLDQAAPPPPHPRLCPLLAVLGGGGWAGGIPSVGGTLRDYHERNISNLITCQTP